MLPRMPSDAPCPTCEAQKGSCNDCGGEGTYAAYATEQMIQLGALLRERGLLNKQWNVWEEQRNDDR